MRRADPHRALVRALAHLYPDLVIVEAGTEPWASVTFTGMRHILRCAPTDVAEIEAAQFTLPGHIVADICAGQRDGALVIEALTIEID